MPVFTWKPVKGADHYEFELAADTGFNSTVANGAQATKNTAVTMPTSLTNGTYYWRLRSVTAKGATSAWTKTRTVALKWAPVMNLTGPADAPPSSRRRPPRVTRSCSAGRRWRARRSTPSRSASIRCSERSSTGVARPRSSTAPPTR